MKKFLTLSAMLLVVAFMATGCGEASGNKQDRKLSERALKDLQKAHPTPTFKRSQLRQNLIEIVTAQAETTQTTTFFFNQGIADPVNQCPSIGFPIPATMQLTNPQARDRDSSAVALPQVEPTGVYTGDTTGTYAMCIDAEGRPYAVYWEGFVQTVTGPAEWADGRVNLIGPPSFDFSGGKKK